MDVKQKSRLFNTVTVKQKVRIRHVCIIQLDINELAGGKNVRLIKGRGRG